MIFDTDVLIWVLRGNKKAAMVVDAARGRSLSVISYMELLQGSRDKAEMRAITACLAGKQFKVLPLTENTGQRASLYMEEFVLPDGLSVTDALVAATAVENRDVLVTGNARHYKPIGELVIEVFRP